MKQDSENTIVVKSKNFAIRCINLYKFLSETKREYILSKQILKSGTSIGANVKEALRAQSKPDFVSKLSISLKEASETEYWLELLYETDYIDSAQFESIISDCRELIRLLTSIIKKINQQNNNTLS